jgi:hypothetical protein
MHTQQARAAIERCVAAPDNVLAQNEAARRLSDAHEPARRLSTLDEPSGD